MSALQALEVMCDRFIDAGIEPERLIPILLEGCENLAMPALVVSILVRHLEQAGDALDPFLGEPAVWHLEFVRTVSEHSGLRSQSPEVHNADRRSWSLRDVAARLALSADDDRAAQLKTIGEQLLERASDHERTDHGDVDRMPEGIAVVKGWAGALDRAAYRATEVDDGILVEQVVDQDVQDVLGPTNEDLRRGNRALGLVLRYRDRHDDYGPKEDVVYDDLLADVALGREVASDPPLAGAYGPFDAPAAVAAGALECRFIDGWDVPLDDLVWSAQLLTEVADYYRSAGESDYEFSYFSQGADRAAARALPFIFLPDAHDIREGLSRQGVGIESLERASNWLTSPAPTEVRLFYARALDHTWRADCDDSEPERCHHGKAMALVEDSTRTCLAGPFDYEKQTDELHPITGPIEHALDNVGDRRIVVPRLSAAIRALGTAATTDNCCVGRARHLLEVVLDAHIRGMLAYEHGYQHSDTLIAARAILASVSVGDDSLLRGHIAQYADDSGLLAELLRALAAVAEENEMSAATARGVWPSIIDQMLDLIDEGHQPGGGGFFEDEGIAALIPNPSYEYGYLHREIDDEPIEWTDVLAWGQQIDRWLQVAKGSYRCVDSLVHLLYSLPIDRQGEIGLKWVETLVAADPVAIARQSFLLPEWLHKIRPYLLDASDPLETWQRIVDHLVVAGDRRVNDLAD